jgi:hypothetical protein
MHHSTSWLLTIGALTLLAACAGADGNQSNPQAPASGVVSSGPIPMPSGSPAEPTPNLVSPRPADNLRPQRWANAQVGAGASQVLIHGTLAGGPPCTVLGRIQLAETQDSVTITLWVGSQKDAMCDEPQPDLGYSFVTQVTLRAPLGSRKIIDGAA